MSLLMASPRSPAPRPPRAPTPGLGAAAALTDAQTPLAGVSAYLTAVVAGTATSAQLAAAQTALVVAQTDVQNALGAQGTTLPPGTWIKGSAVAAIATGAGLAGGIAGYALRGALKKESKKLKEKTR